MAKPRKRATTPGMSARQGARQQYRQVQQQPLPNENLPQPDINAPGERVGGANPEGFTNLPRGN